MGKNEIKLIISDFDGCIADCRELHYEALNRALATIDPKFIITESEHFKIYDGLSTKTKLNRLVSEKGFPADKITTINDLKQVNTLALIDEFEKINYDIINVVLDLKSQGYKFYVASNSVRNTIEKALERIGISRLVDRIYSNEEITHQKPEAEIYLRCMVDAGVNPDETLIIEDSKHGRESALKSGAHLCGVDNSFDFTMERIQTAITRANRPKSLKHYAHNELSVIIPMSGKGSRFDQDPKYHGTPKPLIDVAGKPMIQRVVENLNIDAQYIFVVQAAHYKQHNLGVLLPLIAPECKIVQVDGITEGAACSVLLAKEYINNDKHLLIANSDQILSWNSSDFIYNMNCRNADGGIQTFTANDPKWSYVKVNDDGYVSEVAEKRVISNEASTGVYYFKHGSDFVKYAEQMIEKNIRTNGEYYTAPVYNEMIDANKRVISYRCDAMMGIGIPSDLEWFIENHPELLT